MEHNKSLISAYLSLEEMISGVSNTANDPEDIPRKLQNSLFPYLTAIMLKLPDADTAVRRT